MSEDYFSYDESDAKCKHKAEQPWWNDGDKVAGLAATIFMLTAVIIICICAVAFTLKVAF